MRAWKVTKKEIDNLWVKYEAENPDQGGLDTWDKRLIKLAQKKLVEYLDTKMNFVQGIWMLDIKRKDWLSLLKKVGEK